jgi:hypothetical protein
MNAPVHRPLWLSRAISIPFSDDGLIGCRRCQQQFQRDQSKQELAHHFLLLATENGTPMRLWATGLGVGAP